MPTIEHIPQDIQFLQRYLDGDQEAFAALIDLYRNELYNFLARFTGDPALAEDIFQETFLQLHLSAALFDQTKRLKPWLFTIAANKARDALRSRSRRRAVSLDVAVDSSAESISYGNLIPSDVPPPEESLSNLEVQEAVQNIVDEMPEHLRVVLLMSYFHGMPYKEIAEILDAPLGTIKSRIHAAVSLFAQKWRASAKR
ncbi:MAG: sigma-70 family RNA polymerase sigma factor [Planctomycetaceae bacterium]|nr:sigma-70 family RNA polymerase sigma factor [Planctomycetaceae bacterium]